MRCGLVAGGGGDETGRGIWISESSISPDAPTGVIGRAAKGATADTSLGDGGGGSSPWVDPTFKDGPPPRRGLSAELRTGELALGITGNSEGDKSWDGWRGDDSLRVGVPG